jgi:hypothetical protein
MKLLSWYQQRCRGAIGTIHTTHSHTDPREQRRADAATRRLPAPSSRYSHKIIAGHERVAHNQPAASQRARPSARTMQHDAPPTPRDCHEIENAGQHVNSQKIRTTTACRQAAQRTRTRTASSWFFGHDASPVNHCHNTAAPASPPAPLYHCQAPAAPAQKRMSPSR